MSSNLERARDLFSRGLAAHLGRRWEEAESLYREALALAPGRSSLVFNLGRLALDRGRDQEAEALFHQVLATAPDDHEARYNLGICLVRQGRFEEALAHHDRAIELKPDFADAHSGRGLALGGLGRHEAALASHARSVVLAPDHADLRAEFSRCAAQRQLDERRIDAAVVEPAVLVCLAGSGIDYQLLARVAWAIVHGKLVRLALDPAAHAFDFLRMQALQRQALHDFCNDRLLLAALAKITVGDRATEALFAGMRAGLLRLAVADAAAPATLDPFAPVVIALAQQCFLNEFVWDVTETEQALLDQVERRVEESTRRGELPSAAVGIVACYGPLASKPALAHWARTRAGLDRPELAALVTMQIVEPELEAGIAARLKQLGEVRDATSLAVKAQYEQNPYPRWLSVGTHEPVPYTAQILREIAPFAPPLAPTSDAPRILIAGCGTGRHAIQYATGYRNASVTAIDLSRASLAYASRKAHELGVENVEFLCADVLESDALATKFDVISSVGVLHHLADPAQGLRCLTGLLAPGGYTMVGLYSEAARRDVVELRSIIAREGFDPSVEGIRACRRYIVKDPRGRFRQLLAEAADFYSTSMVRDLLFHVMEHRFTIPQITDLLEQNRLRFLGFTFHDPGAKALYRETFPRDPDMLDLANWAELESGHPWLFRGMYQFWTVKIETA